MPMFVLPKMTMPTRNVVLTDPQAQFVEQLVASGRYQNASEVLREGLRLVQQREEAQASRLQVLREAIVIGMADIEEGRYTTLDDAASLRTHLSSLAKQATPSH